MKPIKFLVGLVCFIPIVLQGNIDTKDAFFIELNQDGLDVLAQELKEQHLQNIQNESLPDFHEKADFGVDVYGRGLRYSVSFESLALRAGEDQLYIDVGIRHLWVEADRLKFKKKIVFNISSTCYDTALEMGHHEVLRLSAAVNLSVVQEEIGLTTGHVQLPISEDNYKVHGPRKCSGSLGLGSLVKWAVKKVLDRARGKIEEALTKQIQKLAPTLEEVLDNAVRQEIEFEINNYIPFENERAIFKTYPHSLSLRTNQLRFHLSADISPSRERFTDGPTFMALDRALLGSLGLNPKLLTEFFEVSFSEGSPSVNLSPELIPEINEILSFETASAIWPDLNKIETEEDYLKASLKLIKTPVFETDPQKQALKVHLPQFRIGFKIKQQGMWRDYFYFDLNILMGSEFNIEEGKLGVAIQTGTQLQVTGNWAPGYEPTEPNYESEMAEVLFTAIFDFLHASGSLVNVAVPSLEIGSTEITLVNPSVSSQFLEVDLAKKISDAF